MSRQAAPFLILCSIISACGGAEQTSSQPQASVHIKAGWLWKTRTIPLCLVNSGQADADALRAIRSNVEAEFARTVVRFSGWQECTADDGNRQIVRLRLNPAGFNLKLMAQRYWSLTIEGNHCIQGMQTARKPIPNEATMANCRVAVPGSWKFAADVPKTMALRAQRMVLSAALHELGHAVGLGEEDTRTDVATAKKCKNAGSVPAVANGVAFQEYAGKYNPASIMSYCRFPDPDEVDWTKLSETQVKTNIPIGFTTDDVERINALYKDRPA